MVDNIAGELRRTLATLVHRPLDSCGVVVGEKEAAQLSQKSCFAPSAVCTPLKDLFC